MKNLILNSVAAVLFIFSTSFAHAEALDAVDAIDTSEVFNEFLEQYPEPASNLTPARPTRATGGRRRVGTGDFNLNGVPVAGECRSFIAEDETLGSYGEIIENELVNRRSDYANMMADNALSGICSNFSNLNARDRAKLYSVVLAAMAFFESSCNQEVPDVQGRNGTLRGLFQLHAGAEAGYDGSDNECIRNASSSAENSIKCTLSILDLQFATQGRLFSSESHWEVLRPNGRSQHADEVRSALEHSRLCE